MMPDMTGWDVLRVAKLDPNVACPPAILMSAEPDQAYPAKVEAFFSKPLDIDALLVAIAQLCDRSGARD
jgi:CheY-like chemotaxis protein